MLVKVNVKKDKVREHSMKGYVEEEKLKFILFLTLTVDGSEIPVGSCLKLWNSFLYNSCLYFRYCFLLRIEIYLHLILMYKT